MRIRAALAWTLGLLAAVVGLGHGAASTPQPSATQRSQTVSIGLASHTSRSALVDSGGPVTTAGAAKTSTKLPPRHLLAGLLATGTALDRADLSFAVRSHARILPPGKAERTASVRGPPGASRA